MAKRKFGLHRWKVWMGLVGLVTITALILACGAEATPTPVPTASPTPRPVATSTPTATPTQPAPGVTVAATPTLTPTATARPTPTPTPTAVVAKALVSPRLKVAIVPPGQQTTLMWKTFHSSTGPQKPMYEFLVYMDRFSGELVKEELATDWSFTPDAKTWTFKLRKGIFFHSTDTFKGPEVTAKDVITTLKLSARDDSNTFPSPSQLRSLGIKDENFEVPNNYELIWRLNLAEPLVAYYASEDTTLGITSKDYWDAVGEEGYVARPIGTGSFQFIELKVGSHILYKRVENHWRKTPEFHELQFFFVPEDATRFAMLLAGESHISDVPRTLLPGAESKGFKIATSTLPGQYIWLRIAGQYYDKPKEIVTGPKKGQILSLAAGYDPSNPFRDLRVRKALNLAIDRDQLNKTFWKGASVPQVVHNIPPGRSDFKPGWKPYPYNPQEAKRLLAEAGYPNGFEFEFLVAKVSGAPEFPDVAEAVATYWQSIGLKPKLKEVEFNTIVSLSRTREQNRNISTHRHGQGPFRSHVVNPMSTAVSGGNNSEWEYDELDEIYLRFLKAVTPEEIIRLTQEMGDWMYNNYVIVPLFFLFPQVAFNPNVLQDYQANHLHFGPVRHHEYTKPVYK